VLRVQLVSLIQQPGVRLPRDAATLDLVEEAIYHALQAGRIDEAECLYRDVLGGMRHLAWNLGETTRGLRVLRGFEACPDRDALAWFLRALGEFDEAYTQNLMPYFRADIRLLQGRLPHVAAEGDEGRSVAAAFLMGRTEELPPDRLGSTVPRYQLLLYRDSPTAARHAARMMAVYQDVGWESDRTRCRLILADAALERADPDACQQHLDAAAGWILHSGSVEHLSHWHWIRARLARVMGAPSVARIAIDEGLHLARSFGMGLFLIEFLCEHAELSLASGDPSAAESAARDALGKATDKDCQYLWGAAKASHLLGQALLMYGEAGAARAVLHDALEMRYQLRDPKARQTERLLENLTEKTN